MNLFSHRRESDSSYNNEPVDNAEHTYSLNQFYSSPLDGEGLRLTSEK